MDDDGVAEDALAIMLEAAEDDQQRPLSTTEVLDSALEMLFAGHLPTSSAACSVLMLLAMNPQVREKAFVDHKNKEISSAA